MDLEILFRTVYTGHWTKRALSSVNQLGSKVYSPRSRRKSIITRFQRISNYCANRKLSVSERKTSNVEMKKHDSWLKVKIYTPSP
jgi:hypothetical protein